MIPSNTFGTSESLDVRLVGGTNSSQLYNGRVEIRRSAGDWGTICDDSFNNRAALVICNMLGYRYGRSISGSKDYFGSGSGDIFMDEVNCHGNETSILDCQCRGWGRHNCAHDEDVGIECSHNKSRCTKHSGLV